MKKLSTYISINTLSALVLLILILTETASADSVIRIIGDRTTTISIKSGDPTVAEPPAIADGGSTTIRIIGDRPASSQAPTDRQAARPEPNQPPSTVSKIRIISDKSDPAQKESTKKPDVVETAVKRDKTETTPEREVGSVETSEQQLALRLEALKAEGNRKAAEKAEQDRIAKLKDEQEIEAQRQAAIIQEQQLAVRKAEESRRAAEKAEKERLAKEKAVHEEEARQAAAKREQEQLAAREAEESRRIAEKAEQERLAKEKIAREEEAAEAGRQRALKLKEEQLAAEKAEQERIAALQLEEERLAAARKSLMEKFRPETDPLAPQPVNDGSPDGTPPASAKGLDPGTVQVPLANNTSKQTPETIWDLYLSAKASDPALGRSEARVIGSKADSDILMASLMPHIDSRAGVQQVSQALANYTNSSDAKYDFTSFNYNVTARLTLLHVPTLYSLSASEAGLNGELAGLASSRQNLIVKFTEVYFALLKAQVDRQIAAGEINRLTQVLDQSRAFLKAGTGDIIAVYEAQSRLDGATADLTKSESNLRLAEQKLSTVAGKPVTSVENYLPQRPTGPEPDNLDWWVTTMEKEQPLVRQAREGVNQITEQRKAAKAEYLPVLQASGGYDVNRGTAALPTAEVRQWFVGASVSLPLYSGGETAAKIRRAVASEAERRQVFEEVIDQHRENVKQAFFNLRYNISFIKALEQRKASAEIQLAAISKGRKIGTRSAIDLLNAEQTYSIAMRDYRYAQYDNFIRVIQLKSAAGILTEADVYDVSRLAAPILVSRLK